MQHYRSTKYWHKLKEQSCFLFQDRLWNFLHLGQHHVPLPGGVAGGFSTLERRENAVKLSSASKTCFSLMLHAEYSAIYTYLISLCYFPRIPVLVWLGSSLSPQVTLSERFISKCQNLSQNCSFGNCSPLARAPMSWVPMWAWTGLLCSTPGLSQWGGRTRQNMLRNSKETIMPSSKISGWLIRFSP